jgi:biotin-[acetyl-CoA-carboxylase] ligase BirA-like protein
MLIYTDSPEYTHRIATSKVLFHPLDKNSTSEIPQEISDELYPEKKIFVGSMKSDLKFNHYFISPYVPISQYDLLIRYAKSNKCLEEDILCFAGSGKNFHGFRQRKWASEAGNIHLSILLHPKRRLEHVETSFLILAANALTKTINDLERMQNKAMIHWVNDVMIDSFKVGGVLAHTQIQGEIADKVILGIGLNLDSSPEIEQDRFVKQVTHVNKFVEGESYPLGSVLSSLIYNIEQFYSAILENKYHDLLNFYIDHSLLIGKKVDVYSDPREGNQNKYAQGVVAGITENLELILDGGQEIIRKGRVKLSNST